MKGKMSTCDKTRRYRQLCLSSFSFSRSLISNVISFLYSFHSIIPKYTKRFTDKACCWEEKSTHSLDRVLHATEGFCSIHCSFLSGNYVVITETKPRSRVFKPRYQREVWLFTIAILSSLVVSIRIIPYFYISHCMDWRASFCKFSLQEENVRTW